jgi:hypothetical protein
MQTVYAIALTPQVPVNGNAEAVFSDVMNAAAAWIKDRYKIKWRVDVDVRPNEAPHSPKPLHSVSLNHVKVPNGQLCRLSWSHPDESESVVRWGTELVVGQWENAIDFVCRVGVGISAGAIRPATYSQGRPRVVTEILRRHPCQLFNWLVPTALTRLPNDRVAAFCDDVLLNRSRSIPVIMVAPRISDGLANVDPVRLELSTRGLAQVVFLEDKFAALMLTRELGRHHACFDGAVKLYWPLQKGTGELFSDRPYLPTRGARAELFGEAVSAEILTKLSDLASHTTSDGEVVRRVRRAMVENARQQDSLLRKQLEDKSLDQARLQEELLNALVRVEQLEDERDRLTDENAALRNSFAEFSRFTSATDSPSASQDATNALRGPQTVREAVDRAAAHFPKTLRFLGSAFRSADDSPFKRPSEVFEAFEALDAVASEWQAGNGRLGKTWGDALVDYGFELKETISDQTLGRYRSDYTFTDETRQLLCDKHMTLGKKTPDTCLSIHWYRDDGARALIIGHCGRHLPNMST